MYDGFLLYELVSLGFGADVKSLTLVVGWNVYEMGMGRKIDAEPGRCRRTDGKKWRCSKEAYPDSKYCERHMHRGKNRSSSRKPLPLTPPQFTPNLFLDPSLSSSRFQTHPSPLFYSNGNTKLDPFSHV